MLELLRIVSLPFVYYEVSELEDTYCITLHIIVLVVPLLFFKCNFHCSLASIHFYFIHVSLNLANYCY